MADTNANDGTADDGGDEPQPFLAWDEDAAGRPTHTGGPIHGLFVDIVVDEDFDEADVLPPGWVTVQLVVGKYYESTDGEFRFTRG